MKEKIKPLKKLLPNPLELPSDYTGIYSTLALASLIKSKAS